MQHIKGSSLSLPAYGREGQGQPFLTTYFAKRNTKNCDGEKRSGESEGGQKFLPPNPLPFCPPERSVWRAKRAISSVQNRFGFRQTNAPEFDFREFARRDWPREARKGMETLTRRAQRGSPSADSKSLAILSICFAQSYE